MGMNNHLTEDQVLFNIVQIGMAIKYCHDRDIIHRDLKPANVVLTETGLLKLIDFGVGKVSEQGNLSSTLLGTMAYMAPEILQSRPYQGETVDLFALAGILFVMRTGSMPFDQMAEGNDRIYGNFTKNEIETFWKIHEQGRESDFFSDGFKDLITSMFHYHPQNRPLIADVVGHPWVQGETPTEQEIKAEFVQRQQAVQ